MLRDKRKTKKSAAPADVDVIDQPSRARRRRAATPSTKRSRRGRDRGEAVAVDAMHADEDVDELAEPTLGYPSHGWVVGPLATANGSAVGLLKAAVKDAKRLAKDLDGLAKAGDRAASGQGDAAARLARLGVVVDALQTSPSAGIGGKDVDALVAHLASLETQFLDLVGDVPGDAVHVMPLPFPAAFASHVPAFGVLPAGDNPDRHNVVFDLLGMQRTEARKADINVDIEDELRRVSEQQGLAEDPAVARLRAAQQAAVEDLAVSAAPDGTKGRKHIHRMLDLPEPLPALD